MERRDKCKSLLRARLLMESPRQVASRQLQVDSHTVLPCQSVVFITCTRLFPLCPPSDIMGRSKVTHIYPIKRDFEKTNIRLQLMLQWGPESERCYRLKRLGFQSPANKRQSSPQRETETEWMGATGRGRHVESEATPRNGSVRAASVSRYSGCVPNIVLRPKGGGQSCLFRSGAARAHVDAFHVNARPFSPFFMSRAYLSALRAHVRGSVLRGDADMDAALMEQN